MLVLSTTRRYTPSRYETWDKEKKPVVLMRQATLEEWMSWRHIQLEVEERRRARHEARLAQIGLSAQNYQEALALQISQIDALTAALEREPQGDGDEEIEPPVDQAKIAQSRAHLEAYQRTFEPELDVERMSDLEHGIALLERVVVGFERVSLPDGAPLPWGVEALQGLGLTRRQVLMAFAGPGIEGLTTLVELTNFAVQGLDPEQKKDSTAT